jgi:prepilin-type N-terminal cleavage/methylation domain-containing protein
MKKFVHHRVSTLSSTRGKAGFTLVEMLIVAAIVLIVTAMALPVFRTAINEYKLRTATVDLTSLLQRARMQ